MATSHDNKLLTASETDCVMLWGYKDTFQSNGQVNYTATVQVNRQVVYSHSIITVVRTGATESLMA